MGKMKWWMYLCIPLIPVYLFFLSLAMIVPLSVILVAKIFGSEPPEWAVWVLDRLMLIQD